MKNIEKSFLNASASHSQKDTMRLAGEYNVPFVDGSADPGCPGIMNPSQTQPIQLRWGSGSYHIQDKVDRFTQFTNALKVVEMLDKGNPCVLEYYKELGIHGRVMVFTIAIKNRIDLLRIIPDAALDLNMSEIPYGKGEKTVTEIFDAYITPIIDSSIQYVTSVVVPENGASGAARSEYFGLAMQLFLQGEVGEFKSTIRLLTDAQSKETLIQAIIGIGEEESVHGDTSQVVSNLITEIFSLGEGDVYHDAL